MCIRDRGPLAVWYRPGAFINYVCFWVCGLPGGVDYACLALVKHGRMHPLTEKHLNAKLNTWMRAPMLIIGAFISFMAALPDPRGGPPRSPGLRVASVLVAIVLAWNACFFCERVVVNYGAKSTQSTAEMMYGGMMPRNLSKGSLSRLAKNLSRDSLMALADAAN